MDGFWISVRCVSITPSQPCLGFAPRSQSFAFRPNRSSRLRLFAIRTNSLTFVSSVRKSAPHPGKGSVKRGLLWYWRLLSPSFAVCDWQKSLYKQTSRLAPEMAKTMAEQGFEALFKTCLNNVYINDNISLYNYYITCEYSSQVSEDEYLYYILQP